MLRRPNLTLFRRFKDDKRGTFAMMTGLMMVPIVLSVGVGTDIARQTQARTRLQQAVDGAVLAGCKVAAKAGTTDAEVTTAVKNYFQGATNATVGGIGFLLNGGKDGEVYDYTPAIARVTSPAWKVTLDLTVNGTIDRMIVKAMLGQTKGEIKATASCEISDSYYEISLVMDNSGSMSSAAGGGKTRIEAARESAVKLVDDMNTSLPGRVKFSVVPFTLTVNTGKTTPDATWMDTTAQSSVHWQNVDRTLLGTVTSPASKFDLYTRLGLTPSGCFETRPGSYAMTDDPPTTTNYNSYYVPYFWPDAPGSGSNITGAANSEASGYDNPYLPDGPTPQCNGASIPTSSSTADRKKRMEAVCKYSASGAVNFSGTAPYRTGPAYRCDAKPIQPLTADSTKVKTLINSMTADGNTNIFEGFMWGWKSVSPNDVLTSGSDKPKAYGEPKNVKIVILLTDGQNYWGQIGGGHTGSIYSPMGFFSNARITSPSHTLSASSSAGQAQDVMDYNTEQGCINARNKGVVIYTIGFASSRTDINETLLKSCASAKSGSSDKHYYYASSTSELSKAFKEIMDAIKNIALSK
jgi:Flp pilus assembly protein TadG